MAAMLRVAIALDRSHDGRVATVAVGSANGAGALRVGVAAADGADISLELQTPTSARSCSRTSSVTAWRSSR